MKSFAALVTVIALGVGALVGTAAYQVAAAPHPDSVAVPVAREQAQARVVPGARFRWAPCRGQATLRRGVCVTELVTTIAVPAAVSNQARPSAAPSPQAEATSGESDEGRAEEADDHADEDDESEAHESEDDTEDHESEDEHEDEHEDGEYDD